MTSNRQWFSRRLGHLTIVLLVSLYVGSALAQDAYKSPLEKPAKSDSKESPPRAQNREIKIFSLVYAEADKTVQLLAQMMPRETRFAPDRRTNSIIAEGSRESLLVAEAIVKRLDSSESVSRGRLDSKPIRIRIIWLAEGLARTEASAPVNDLKGVAEELARLGVKDVRQVAQAVVRTQSDGKFQISCTPLLEGAPVTFVASGKVNLDGGVSNLQIQLSATRQPLAAEPFNRARGIPAEKLVNLELNTVVRQSEYAVLGVAPVGKITSIFVIQVTVGEPK